MPGLDNIIKKIKEDANAVQEQMNAQTKAATDKIIQAARLEMEEKRQDIINRAQIDGRLKQERMVSMAKLEGSKTLLKTKRDLMEKVFDNVQGLLSKIPDQEYEELLIRMITNVNPRESGTIRLNQQDLKRISPTFISRVNEAFRQQGKNVSFTLGPAHADKSGGFVMVCGNMEINSTFDKIIGMQKTEFESIVSNTLFSD